MNIPSHYRAIGKSRRHVQSGFTLIEVMLVAVLMGLAAAVVMYTVNSSQPQDELRRSARKLAALTELALDKAVLSGRDFGIAFSDKNYHFVELIEQRWQAAKDPLLTEQSLEKIEMSLEVEGFAWRPDLDSFASNELFSEREIDREQDEVEKPHIPQLLVLSSGELTPFVINFRIDSSLHNQLSQIQQDYQVDIKGNSLGLVEVIVVDE